MLSQIKKLEAHSRHLLNGFIVLRQRYAMLAPMLFESRVRKQWGSGVRALGFSTLKSSLFLSCAQDITKLALDRDNRTPSITNLISYLEDPSLCAALRTQYAAWVTPLAEPEADPEIIAIIEKMEAAERAARLIQFDEIMSRVRCNWKTLKGEPHLNSFRTIRDKVSAHTEMLLGVDGYQTVDISKLGIKWSDIELTIKRLELIVEDLGLLITNRSFAWDRLDELLAEGSKAFWLISERA
jgi:hypothetical protein